MRKRSLKLRTETIRQLQGRTLQTIRGAGTFVDCTTTQIDTQCDDCTGGVRSVNTVPCNGGGEMG